MLDAMNLTRRASSLPFAMNMDGSLECRAHSFGDGNQIHRKYVLQSRRDACAESPELQRLSNHNGWEWFPSSSSKHSECIRLFKAIGLSFSYLSY